MLHPIVLLTSAEILNWADYFEPAAFRDQAENIVRGIRSEEELLALSVGAVRVGGCAASSARRQLRTGTLNFEDESVRAVLIDRLGASLASVEATERLMREMQPSLVLTEDTVYIPRAVMLDICGQKDIPLIRWYPAHKTSALMLKRYLPANRDHDLNSLSEASWQLVREMEWSSRKSDRSEAGADAAATFAKIGTTRTAGSSTSGI